MRYIIYPLAVVAVLLFFVLLNNSSELGGGALSGKAENGHFYVGSPRGYTEVTRQEYQTTKMLEIAAAIIWPITMIGILYIEWMPANILGKRLRLWLERFTRPEIKGKKMRKRNR